MPIRPENKRRYPAAWPEISRQIREVRAENRCECRGECGDVHGQSDGRPCIVNSHPSAMKSVDVGRCNAPNGVLISRHRETPGDWIEFPEAAESGLFDFDDYLDPIRVVLTVAHRDHIPEHVDEANLFAACQRCHNRYDAAHRAITARSTRRAHKAAGELFE